MAMGGASYTSVQMGLLGVSPERPEVPAHAPHCIGERALGKSGCPRPTGRAGDISSLALPAAGSAEP